MTAENQTIEVNNTQRFLPVDVRRLERAVRVVLEVESVPTAEISLAIVDNKTIHDLNRRYLHHDYATDVLSLVLESSPRPLVGEIVVSAEMAIETAPRYHWRADEELILYVIHGTLHLTGHNDQTASDRRVMRSREQLCLNRLGIVNPAEHPVSADRPTPPPSVLSEGICDGS